MIFIISCARSGSSILGETLGQCPGLLYFGEELQHFWHTMGGLKSHHEIDEADIKDGMADTVREEIIKPTLWHGQSPLDKCPPNILRIPFLANLLPEAKFLFLVRDGRDVALSLGPGLSDGWSHLKPKNWETLSQVEPLPLRGALLWAQVNLKAAEDLARHACFRYKIVKYEDLVFNPVTCIAEIFDFLGIFEGRLPALDFAQQNISNDALGGYQAKGQESWFRPDHKVRAGRYKAQLDEVELATLHATIGQTLEGFGYLVE